VAGGDEKFIQRWSRLKQAEAEPPIEAEIAGESAMGDLEAVEEEAPAAEEVELPDVDSLDKDSDYTGFLAEGVPEALRNKALRKLWLSDPVLANLDGLNDYDEDFTLLFKTVKEIAEGLVKSGDDPAREEGKAAEADEADEADEVAEVAEVAEVEATEPPAPTPESEAAEEIEDDPEDDLHSG
jgi:hypothetical protein